MVFLTNKSLSQVVMFIILRNSMGKAEQSKQWISGAHLA